MKILMIIVAAHGFIHMMGFMKAFRFAALDQLKKPVSKFSGILWLLATIMFIVALAMMLLHREAWWIAALPAVLLSQGLIIRAWQDAKFGTIANVVILIPAIIAALDFLPSSYVNMYRAEVKQRLTGTRDTSKLTEADLADLPAPVAKYLHYAGAVGRPKVQNFMAAFSGSMKQKRDGKWLDIRSQQYNFYDDTARLFYIRSSLSGIPFDGFHRYTGHHAVMLIRIANLFRVADARGEKMDRGETVTLFNDMCLLAPATLISRNIRWREISSTMVEARFTNRGNTISAYLFFNEEGAMTNFISYDRYMSSDGKTYQNYPWSTPVAGYKESDGRRIPSRGEAIWHTPSGPFSYARFVMDAIVYNVTSLTPFGEKIIRK